jgi:hypothetical protein
MGEGAAIQAAIALIREHVPGLGGAGLQSVAGANKYDQRTTYTPLGAQTTNIQRFSPGQIIDTPAGKRHQAGPLGAGTSAPNFAVVEQALLRYVGIRWHFPEYLISGDASNANYSSTLVAESPFVKGREADQGFYVSRYKRIMWKVLRIANAGGAFDAFGLEWPMIEAMLDLTITPPTVASRNATEETSRSKVLHDAGLLSKPTWSGKEGLDHEDEVAKGASVVVAPELGLPALPDSEQTARPSIAPNNLASDEGLNGAQITSAVGVLDAVTAGRTPKLVAVELLVAVGIDQAKAQRMVDASAKLAPVTESAEERVTAEAVSSRIWQEYGPVPKATTKRIKRDAAGLIVEIEEVNDA